MDINQIAAFLAPLLPYLIKGGHPPGQCLAAVQGWLGEIGRCVVGAVGKKDGRS